MAAMGLTPKKFRQKQLAEKEKAKLVNKDPLTKKTEVKTDDLPSKKTLKKRMKSRLDEGEEGIDDAMKEVRAEEKRLKRAAKALGTDGKPKPTKRQRKIADFEARAAARGDETPEAKSARQVYVGNLPLELNQDQLRAHFIGCGEIAEIRVMMRPSGEKSRGFGFIVFKDKASCASALKLNGLPFAGRELKVSGTTGTETAPLSKDAKRKKDMKGNPELEVMFGNMPFGADKKAIRKKVKECGPTDRVLVPYQTYGKFKGRHKGVAFVTYKTEEAFQKALALNGTVYKGVNIKAIKHGTEVKTEKRSKDVEMGEGDDDDDEEEEEEEEEEDDE